MKFFTHLHKSLWDIDWLKTMSEDRKKSWQYFLLFMVLLCAAIFAPMFIKMPTFFEEVQVYVDEEIPEFNAKFESGELVVSELEQPYTLNIPLGEEGEDYVLVYIDTSSTEALSAEELSEQMGVEAVFLFVKDRFEIYDTIAGYQSQSKRHQIQSFEEIPDAEFAKQDMVSWLAKWKGLKLAGLMIGLFALMYIFTVIGKLVYLLVWSLLLRVIALLAKKDKWKYSTIYTLGLSGIILPSVVLLIAQYIAFRPPYVYSLIFAVLMLSVMFREPEKKNEKHEESKS